MAEELDKIPILHVVEVMWNVNLKLHFWKPLKVVLKRYPIMLWIIAKIVEEVEQKKELHLKLVIRAEGQARWL